MRISIALAVTAISALTSLAVATTSLNTLSESEKKDGWTLLFDGTSTVGWRGFNKQTCPAGWKAVDGALTRVAEAGDIVTVDQYQDFDLTFDWRIAKNGNSGLFFHVAEGPDLKTVFVTGPEYQLLDNDGHPDGKNGPDRWSGADYALHAPTKNTARAVGEWNESRILVKGPHVEHWLNGEKVVEYELWSADWKNRVAKSKFNAMPRYGLEKTGHIALQDHGSEVAFRNVKIKVLN
jgi:hypothetical protein